MNTDQKLVSPVVLIEGELTDKILMIVGDHVADLVIDGKVIVECKAGTSLDPVHEAQLMNYLRASGIRVGLLLNFGRPKLQFRRFVA